MPCFAGVPLALLSLLSASPFGPAERVSLVSAPTLIIVGPADRTLSYDQCKTHLAAGSAVRHVCPGDRLNILPVSEGGFRCEPSSELSHIGFLLHYGVSPSDDVYFGRRSAHAHPGWNGRGFAVHNGKLHARSPDLISEAVTRFRRNTPAVHPVVVVFNSLPWDIGRKQDGPARRESTAQWFARQTYTPAARALLTLPHSYCNETVSLDARSHACSLHAHAWFPAAIQG